MPTFHGKLVGEFTIRQTIVADNEEEARTAFQENRGDDIECIATGEVTVSEIEQVD